MSEWEQKLIQLSKQYVPEWRMDTQNPDLGTTLAILFLHMHKDTIQKYQDIPLKWKTSFFQHLHTSLQTETPATGYVCFELVNESVTGAMVPKGTRLEVTQTDTTEIPLETCDDVFVGGAKLLDVYESYDKKDYIGRLWQQGEQHAYTLFGMEAENIQSHCFCISQETVFSITQSGEIQIQFFDRTKKPLSEYQLQILLQQSEFFYTSEQGLQRFEQQYCTQNKMVFVKGASQPPWTAQDYGGISAHWLYCSVNNAIPFSEFVLGDIKIQSQSTLLLPEHIYASGVDCDIHEAYYPFGEQPSLYEEVYFCCSEALQKKGAFVTLSFVLDFVKIPLQMTPKQNIDWKLVMNASTIPIEKEYDITISEVIWEYFNGIGWARLHIDKSHTYLFDIESGTHTQKKTILFCCPEDIAPTIVHAQETYCIRARVLRMTNVFQTQGQYITPVLSETYFCYEYTQEGKQPEYIYTQQECVSQICTAKQAFSTLQGFQPFCVCGDDKHAIYFRFSKPFEKGPCHILAILSEGKHWKRPQLRFQYYGVRGWQNIQLQDETLHFANSGLIRFHALPDHERLTKFGVSGYWLRVLEETGSYETVTKEYLPTIENLYLHGVRAWTVHTNIEEFFTLEDFSMTPQFEIQHSPIVQASVWVNETGKLSKTEEQQLQSQHRLSIKKNVYDVTEYWVKWQEINPLTSTTDERVYILDKDEKKLYFPKKLPAPNVVNGIFVSLVVGGGAHTNIQSEQVTGMEQSIGYINQVQNPIAFSGGCDKETPEQAIIRTSAERKHRFRAVMAEDFVYLSKQASPMVYRSFCFTGKNAEGKPQSGHITLVLLQKAYAQSHCYFPMLREIVKNYLYDKVFVNLLTQHRLHIISPTFVELQICASIGVSGLHEIFECETAVQQALSTFLDPITGNFTGNGFDVGVLPTRNQIEMVLMNIPSVKEVKHMLLTGKIQQRTQTIEVDNERLYQIPYALPVNGIHRIHIYGM